MCGGGFIKEFYQFRHSLPSIGNFGPVFLDCLPGILISAILSMYALWNDT